ncbi:MAG TPA: DNA-3-methyladenine glycosylase [Firmicutes bacterium]|jgi:DNA-3-methyladenine glycosylase|nr:DNA-3-methyladenine glycosylase [Bacillota bacterium]
MSGKPLPREFFQRDALQLAHDLLGCTLVHASPEGLTAGIIVETEAYRGPADAAAHTYRGKRTARTAAMYGPAGHAYIYLIYGMYECLNVVGGDIDNPEAVLIRALEPVSGVELMAQRRRVDMTKPRALRQLCSGPGKLTQAMGITRAEHYGIDLCGNVLYVTPGRIIAEAQIATTPRINIDYAGEWRDLPWRYIVKDSPYLSRPWRGA